MRIDGPDGSLIHSELKVGDSTLYLSDESPEWSAVGLAEGATAPCVFFVESDDSDADLDRAVGAGATVVFTPVDREGVGRTGVVRDPFGYRWAFIDRSRG